MAVLMSRGGAGSGPNGGERRCDATCHDAKPDSTCVCICGGRYHGGGRAKAFQAHQQDALDGVWGDDLRRVAQLYQAEKQTRTEQLVRPLVYQSRPRQATFTFV